MKHTIRLITIATLTIAISACGSQSTTAKSQTQTNEAPTLPPKSVSKESYATGVNAGFVKNVLFNSDRQYKLVKNGFRKGVPLWSDRNLKVTKFSSELTNGTLIQTPMEDRANSNRPLISFTVAENADVFVGIKDTSTPPNWLKSWQKTNIKVSAGNNLVYYKNFFAAGNQVVLGASTGLTAMYSVVIKSAYPSNSVSASSTSTKTSTHTSKSSTSLILTPLVNSDNSYSILPNGFVNGAKLWTDRNYKVTAAPESLTGSTLIQTPMQDRTNKSDVLISFTAGQDCYVYIGLKAGSDKSKPKWLNNWEATEIEVNASNKLKLYRQKFSAGQLVTLGSLGGKAQAMYSIVVQKA